MKLEEKCLAWMEKNYYMTWQISLRLKLEKDAQLTELDWLSKVEYNYVIIDI